MYPYVNNTYICMYIMYVYGVLHFAFPVTYVHISLTVLTALLNPYIFFSFNPGERKPNLWKIT